MLYKIEIIKEGSLIEERSFTTSCIHDVDLICKTLLKEHDVKKVNLYFDDYRNRKERKIIERSLNEEYVQKNMGPS